jgi:hypothetical protein
MKDQHFSLAIWILSQKSTGTQQVAAALVGVALGGVGANRREGGV